jgi:hypothetical protein
MHTSSVNTYQCTIRAAFGTLERVLLPPDSEEEQMEPNRDSVEILRSARRRHARTGAPRRLRIAINIAAAVVILGLVSLTMVLALRTEPCGSREQTARIDIAAIRVAAQLYRVQYPDRCPSVKRLVEAGILEEHRRITDPWDNDYVIECDGGEVLVFSSGPDGLPNTADDVR